MLLLAVYFATFTAPLSVTNLLSSFHRAVKRDKGRYPSGRVSVSVVCHEVPMDKGTSEASLLGVGNPLPSIPLHSIVSYCTVPYQTLYFCHQSDFPVKEKTSRATDAFSRISCLFPQPIIILSDSDVEDTFSSTHFPDYIPASPDYFPALPGNTSPNFSDDLTKDLLASLALSPIYDDPYMKVMQAYDATDNELPQAPIAPPTILPPSLVLSLSPMFDFLTFLSLPEYFNT
ncbi:hypothetical protein Tco_1137625 [Tanacetum coccineum]